MQQKSIQLSQGDGDDGEHSGEQEPCAQECLRSVDAVQAGSHGEQRAIAGRGMVERQSDVYIESRRQDDRCGVPIR